VRPEDYINTKIPITLSGIKPATFRLVASCGGMSKRVKSKICPLFRGEENYIH
jgi:hypothetical protein